MDYYSVLIEGRVPGDGPALTEDHAFALLDAVQSHAGTASAEGYGWDSRISAQAAGAADAVNAGVGVVTAAAAAAGIPRSAIVRAEAVREDILDAELAQSPLPDLVSGPEAAEILGVSIQRVHQLAAEHSDFPGAAYELRAGRLWFRAAIVKFSAEWKRKPGRPRKSRKVA